MNAEFLGLRRAIRNAEDGLTLQDLREKVDRASYKASEGGDWILADRYEDLILQIDMALATLDMIDETEAALDAVEESLAEKEGEKDE